MTIDIEVDTFRSSILYWIGILEGEANLQFVQEMKGGKSDVPVWRTLSILSELDGITVGDLARHTHIERTALSHLLTQMEKQMLVERRPLPSNRRTIQVFLLEEGRRTFERMLPVRRMVFRRATQGIAREDLETMMLVTRRLIENLRAASGEAEPEERLHPAAKGAG
ncbi:MarR family winged helix-turn-helix transcriptional regulator [Oceanicella sp. SM1341]|uniref:MarR family winged helix-turn-helix transcriptional regulator n=1 Tax=Oceanicella sp. SM1341 TaxID=1548889 RepID=UPI001300B915|nr:MarR family transcriptional regulator [Oceanicella sp. SM1341]